MKYFNSIRFWFSNRSAIKLAGNLQDNQSSTIKVGLYEHFKGNRYYVFGTARHSENEEVMVVYAPDKKREELWVRPLHMFEEQVETASGVAPRFVYIPPPDL